jgi:tRNA dimethylallyltransferase
MTGLKTTKKKLIIIAGPTAVGKTACGIRIAQRLESDIISADSRQIYQEMNIGTAKPSKAELALVKHHFIDFLPVCSNYNAGKFASDVHSFLDEYFLHRDVCLMVGGTGLYINAVIDGLDEFPDVPVEILEKVKIQWKEEGINSLRSQLLISDPEYYQKVDLHNPHRLIRALSVCLATNQTYTSFLNRAKKPLTFEPVFILLNMDREILYHRINERADDMIKNGLIEEVHGLLTKRHCQALQTVGYRELMEFFDGNIPMETAIEKIKQNSRRYAKRQLTWFNNDGRYTRFDPENPEAIFQFVDQIINE